MIHSQRARMRQFVSRKYHVCMTTNKKQTNKQTRNKQKKKKRKQNKKQKYSRGEKSAFRVIEEDSTVIAEIAALDRIRHEVQVLETFSLALGRRRLASHTNAVVAHDGPSSEVEDRVGPTALSNGESKVPVSGIAQDMCKRQGIEYVCDQG
jgi:hypothetical protein